MGEVVVSSSEERMEVREEGEKNKESNKEGSMVRWEIFLPKMNLRVLLVEADDSTRQIIGALLRKCSYKVTSVADGLKAWEVLKGRPHNIDLILTEAELPSISGYALLTLIMEHEVCKNIPVIMMSTHDSVSVVYKCMLRGAADFLVKPIRINELKNLWQHVWRRQSQLNRGGLGPQDDSVGQEKLEATAENNANSDRSSSSKTCAPRQDQCTKKGSDAQSSCGKPDVEADSAYMAVADNYLHPKQGISPVSDLIIQEHGTFGNSSYTPESAIAGSDTAVCNSNSAVDKDQKGEEQNRKEILNLYAEANENGNIRTSTSREAIDLIGALANHSTFDACKFEVGNRLELSQQLDLTLRRFLPGELDNKTSDEMLNHSNSSAFTRYVNKASHLPDSNPTSILTPKDNIASNSADYLYDNARGNMYRKVISLPTNNLTKEVENEYRNASQKLFPISLPGRGVQVEVCPMVCTPSSSPSLSSANQQMNSYHQFGIDMINSRHHFSPVDQNPRLPSNQPISMQDQKMESLEDRAHFSCAADQSASSLNGGGSEGGNDQSQVTHELNRQRSLQREAALNKFRLKRKERCYGKKVRYESRKKLAEQRPRVKGQFVRQVPPDPPPMSDHSGVNSAAN